MKNNPGPREGFPKAGDLEMLGWILKRRELRHNDEAEALVVPMVAEKHTPLGALLA